MSSDVLAEKGAERKLPPQGRISFEEFLAWCDEDTLAEWVDGEVIMMSPASDQHQDLLEFLITILRFFNETYQVGWVRVAPFLMRTSVHPSGREYWLIDPLRQQAEFYKLDPQGRYRLGPVEEGVYHSHVLPGFWLRVAWLWQQPLPAVLSVLKELGVI